MSKFASSVQTVLDAKTGFQAGRELLNLTFDRDARTLPTFNRISLLLGRGGKKKDFNESLKNLSHEWNIRSKYVQHSFPLLSDELLATIKAKIVDDLKLTKVIELSCGPGWLTVWLRKYGVNVLKCVDNFSWKSFVNEKTYLDIVEMQDSVFTVKANPDTDLFVLSWPYMDPLAANVWKAMQPNQYLLYIGEDQSGCTADDDFFDLIEGCEVETCFPLMQFDGLHDEARLFLKPKKVTRKFDFRD